MKEQSLVIYTNVGLEMVSLVPKLRQAEARMEHTENIKLELSTTKTWLCVLNAGGFGRAQDLGAGREEFLAKDCV